MTTTTTIQTSELTGAALDWAVAKSMAGHIGVANGDVCFDTGNGEGFNVFTPSTDWSQGGPIIEREMIQLTPKGMVNPLHGWAASYRSFDEEDDVYALHRMRGKTPLIAAMRCYVASKLGDTVDIPPDFGA